MSTKKTNHRFDFRLIKEGDSVVWMHPEYQSAIFEFGRCIQPPRFIGSKRYSGKIIKDLFGKNNRHAFSIQLTEPIEYKGKKKIVHGVQLFPNLIEHKPGEVFKQEKLDA